MDMDTNAELPSWFPKLTDAAWVARIRADYPEDTEGMSDEDVVQEYADGSKYATLWDHVGEAYDDYEPLADAYLAATAERDTLKALCVDWKPIESAPKDEHVLIWWPPINRATIAILRTKGRKRGWQVFLGYFGGANCAYVGVAPCDWKPLPPPPTTPPPCGSEGK